MPVFNLVLLKIFLILSDLENQQQFDWGNTMAPFSKEYGFDSNFTSDFFRNLQIYLSQDIPPSVNNIMQNLINLFPNVQAIVPPARVAYFTSNFFDCFFIKKAHGSAQVLKSIY